MLSLRVDDSERAVESRNETDRLSQQSEQNNNQTKIFGRRIVIVNNETSFDFDINDACDGNDNSVTDTDSIIDWCSKSNFKFAFVNESSHDCHAFGK